MGSCCGAFKIWSDALWKGSKNISEGLSEKAQTVSFQDGVSSSALYLEALTTQLMEGTLIKWGTNHKIREMEIRHGQMIQVQGRFMGEVVL